MADKFTEAESTFQKLVMMKFRTLPQEEQAKIDKGLQRLVKQLKGGNKHPISTNTVLMALMTAMYYAKYQESPVDTIIATQDAQEQKVSQDVRALAEVYA